MTSSNAIGVRIDIMGSSLGKAGSSSSLNKYSPKPKLSAKSTFAKKP